jgi:hypothetical protein
VGRCVCFAEVVCCAPVPGPRGQRMQEVGRRPFDVLTELTGGHVWIPATT